MSPYQGQHFTPGDDGLSPHGGGPPSSDRHKLDLGPDSFPGLDLEPMPLEVLLPELERPLRHSQGEHAREGGGGDHVAPSRPDLHRGGTRPSPGIRTVEKDPPDPTPLQGAQVGTPGGGEEPATTASCPSDHSPVLRFAQDLRPSVDAEPTPELRRTELALPEGESARLLEGQRHRSPLLPLKIGNRCTNLSYARPWSSWSALREADGPGPSLQFPEIGGDIGALRDHLFWGYRCIRATPSPWSAFTR